MTLADRLLSRLSRRTTSGDFIPEIDGLRFVSIALVVLFHLSGYTMAKSSAARFANPVDDALARVAATGHYGVQLFFIISGFVLALPFARHRLRGGPAPNLRAYYLRRLTRLEPPYIIAMVGVFAAATLVFGASARALWPHLLASLTYVHNLVYGTGSTVNVVAWSLEVEVQFYVLAPVLGLVFALSGKWIRRGVLVAGMAGAMVLQATVIGTSGRLALTLLNFAQFFLLGFLLADVYLDEWRVESATPLAWDVAALLAWPALITVWMVSPRPLVLFPVLALIAFCATFRSRLVRRAFRNRWVTTIGGMCYTIYLLHYPLISALGRRTVALGGGEGYALRVLVQAGIIVPVLLVVSAAYFAAVERPCMRKDWPQRLAVWVRSTAWLRPPAAVRGEPDAAGPIVKEG